MQTIEDDISKLQVQLQGSSQLSGQDKIIAQLSQRVHDPSQNPLWHEMQKTTVEVQHFKEKISPAMTDIEIRLKQLEAVAEERIDHHDMQNKPHNVLEVLKSAGALPKGEGPIVQVLDSIRRWEEQFLQVCGV